MVRAAGLVLYRQAEGRPVYLMMRASYGAKHWTPPKGHVDPGEDLLETALRETEEEAGLSRGRHYELHEAFERRLEYMVRGAPKEVHYWLARLLPEVPPSAVRLSEEHTEYRWLPLDEAAAIGGYDDMTSLLKECEAFIGGQ